MAKLVILGSGGYGRTVADVAEQLGYTIQFLDVSIPDHPLSSFSSYIDENTLLFRHSETTNSVYPGLINSNPQAPNSPH